ncbi:MAG TPA: LytTR family DNA-binding domain-containing protein [Pyrinomonadaceae bacterium]|jgi:two-component system LytT family response regulator/two-component system response regulator LytT|nr:LytTR family DNA-binding domain-containing protein [Pyrinomonadaceae bacterium]
MIETLLVDDEELARSELRETLSTESDIKIVGEAVNGVEAVKQIYDLRPGLVFLDIEMPGLNGLEVVASLASPPVIIFVTAYDQYAIHAFEVNALDYLLKPVTADRVRKALGRVRQVVANQDESHWEAVQNLLTTLHKKQTSYISRIAVHKGPRVLLVSVRDIVFIAVEDKLVYVHTATGRFLINKAIYEIGLNLKAEGFFQINRSTIINLEYLTEILPWFSGTYKLKLQNGKELSLSRERASGLKEAVGLLKQPQAFKEPLP